MRSQRINEIYEYVFERKTVTIDKLCEKFAISKSTLRRDLEELVGRGLLKKTYGGVMSAEVQRIQTPAYSERHIVNAESKRRIAERAAALVDDGDVIFIDSGSTNIALADYIADRRNLTILTNNIPVILKAIPHPDINVITLAGTLNRRSLSFTGEMASQILSGYNIAKAFMGTTGFSLENGITNTSSTEISIKKMAVERSRQAYVLADHTKAGVVSLFTYAHFADIAGLVTDRPLPEFASALAESGCRILIAEN